VLIQDVSRKHSPFDKPDGEAEYLIRTGQFVRYEAKTFEPPKPAPVLIWSVKEGARIADYQHPPYLYAQCPACGNKWWTEPSPTSAGNSHTSLKIYHCGQRAVMCPTAVAAEYLNRFAAWKARSKKQPIPVAIAEVSGLGKISPHTPDAISRLAGVKSSKELAMEAAAAAQPRVLANE
jgi:hypothetical protein